MFTDKILRNKARNAARSGNWDMAIRHYRQLCRTQFDNAKDAIQLGHALKESDDSEQALAVYLRAADVHREDADAQRQAALFLMRLGRRNDAAVYFARTLILDSRLDDVRTQLQELGFRDALALDAIMLKAGLTGSDRLLKPISPIRRFLMGAALRQARASSKQHNWSNAESCYRAVLKHASGQPRVLTQLGHALREQGKLEEALIEYRRATLLSPRDPDPYVHIGHALKQLERRDSALEAYFVSWRLRPGQPEVLREIHVFRSDFSGDVLDSGNVSPPDQGNLELGQLIIERVERIERSQLAEESWLDHRQRVIFKFLSGSLAYKE
jgi:tetratricopeptide (TPR) repeat protein